MSDRGRVLGALAGYNVIQNTVVPDIAYVPANLSMTVGLVVMARRRGCSWYELGLHPNTFGSGAKLGLRAAAITSAAVFGAAANPRFSAYFLDERAAGHPPPEVLYRALIRFPLGTALFEEVAFRGVTYAIWRQTGASRSHAVAMASLAFGLWHVIPASQALKGNPLEANVDSPTARTTVVMAGVVGTAVAGVLLSWTRHRSRSLVAPWLIHAGLNTATYLAGVAAWKRHRGDKS